MLRCAEFRIRDLLDYCFYFPDQGMRDVDSVIGSVTDPSVKRYFQLVLFSATNTLRLVNFSTCSVALN